MTVRADEFTLLHFLENRLAVPTMGIADRELLRATNVIEVHALGWESTTAILARVRLQFI